MFAQQLFYSIAAMNALFSSMAWCAAKPTTLSVISTVTFAVIWPFVNGILEGNLLVTLTSTHGITVSDLLSVAAVALALGQAVRIRRAARGNQPAAGPGH